VVGPDQPEDEKSQRALQSALQLSHVGLQFAMTIGLLFYAGLKADEHWGTSPVFMLLGLVSGFSAGFYHLYRTVYAKKQDAPPK
jgi:F0F1-type ATP synthase assembly protein I